MTDAERERRIYHHLYETCEGIAQQTERIVKLEELVAELYEFAMSEYPDGTELNFADRMRELGIEVDE